MLRSTRGRAERRGSVWASRRQSSSIDPQLKCLTTSWRYQTMPNGVPAWSRLPRLDRPVGVGTTGFDRMRPTAARSSRHGPSSNTSPAYSPDGRSIPARFEGRAVTSANSLATSRSSPSKRTSSRPAGFDCWARSSERSPEGRISPTFGSSRRISRGQPDAQSMASRPSPGMSTVSSLPPTCHRTRPKRRENPVSRPGLDVPFLAF